MNPLVMYMMQASTVKAQPLLMLYYAVVMLLVDALSSFVTILKPVFQSSCLLQWQCQLLVIEEAKALVLGHFSFRLATLTKSNKKAVLSQGNRVMPQLFFSV